MRYRESDFGGACYLGFGHNDANAGGEPGASESGGGDTVNQDAFPNCDSGVFVITPPADATPSPFSGGDDHTFYHSVYVYVPPALRGDPQGSAASDGGEGAPGDAGATCDAGAGEQRVRIIVIPNNTGHRSDDIGVHTEAAMAELFESRALTLDLARAPHHAGGASESPLQAVIVMPVFPRPESPSLGGDVYVHALDAASLTTTIAGIGRPDLQLLGMVDSARNELRRRHSLCADGKVVMWGFSASGMFGSRFTALHPDRVAAAVVGSSSLWPIAPVASVPVAAGSSGYTPDGPDVQLGYPVGVADLPALVGRAFDGAAFAPVPQFVFVGADDPDDALAFTPAQQQLIYDNFGGRGDNVARWAASEALYRAVGADRCVFTVVAGVQHRFNWATKEAAVAWLRNVAAL